MITAQRTDKCLTSKCLTDLVFVYWRGVVWLLLVGVAGALLVVPLRRSLLGRASMVFPTGAALHASKARSRAGLGSREHARSSVSCQGQGGERFNGTSLAGLAAPALDGATS